MRRLTIVSAIALSLVLAAGAGYAAAAKQYQYTGTVTEVGSGTISVDKGGEIWQFSTEGSKDLKAKKGDKVTVYYKMVVQKIDTK
ncbi:hypothetical protein [Pendulispora albinea]|uniref:Uncharacterized protein n=1 Tax=Pendulispora albinea TaxID=2741071 RepID=A0ABZ2M631_9BACT